MWGAQLAAGCCCLCSVCQHTSQATLGSQHMRPSPPSRAQQPAPVRLLHLSPQPQLLSDAAPSLSNVSRLRLVNAGARGADAAALANALLQLRSLRVLQLHQVRLEACNTVSVSQNRPAVLTAAEPRVR